MNSIYRLFFLLLCVCSVYVCVVINGVFRIWLYLCSCLDQVKSSVQEYITRMLTSEREVRAIITV